MAHFTSLRPIRPRAPVDYLSLAAEYDAASEQRQERSARLLARVDARQATADRRWQSWYGRIALGLTSVVILAALSLLPALCVGLLAIGLPWSSPWPYVTATIVALVCYILYLEQQRQR